MKKIIIPAIAIIALSSCKSFSHSSRIIDVKNEDVVSTSYTATVTADFSKRINGSSNKRHKSEASAKKEAYYNAIIENDIDVLVDPIYSVFSTKKILFLFGGKSQATVYGYAGNYSKIKSDQEISETNHKQAIKDLKRLGKINNILDENQQKTTEVNSCGDSKNNKTLINSVKNKSSIVDIYQKLKNN